MSFRNSTEVTQEVNDAIIRLKYAKGRWIGIVISFLMGAGGIVMIALSSNSYVYGAGWGLLVVGLLFFLTFTLAWKTSLKGIIARERSKHPIKDAFTLTYEFTDEEVAITLKPRKGSPIFEKHPYDFFSALEITPDYFFFVYDPKEAPLPYKRHPGDDDELAFLRGKIAKNHHYKK
jgi:hypothetical protein